MVDYLTWFKDLDTCLQGRRGVHLLMSSNVPEPVDLLEQHIRDHWEELRRLQTHNNDWGHPVLKDRIAARYGVKPENILLANGCTNANYLTVASHVRPGGTVVCEIPAYQPLWQAAKLAGAGVKWIRRRPPHYQVDPDELSSLVDRRTSLVILTNLHNPSGALLDEGDLKEIARAVRRKNKLARVLVDEVFRDFVPGKPMPAFRTDPTFISTGSLSKVYGLSHLECGWILADRKTVERITPWFVLAEGNGSRYLESLSAVVFAHLEEHLARSRAIVIQNRKILCQALEPLIDSGLLQGNVPEHGCIYFTTVAGCRDTAALARRLAQKYNIYIVPGAFFGQASGMRIGFGGEPGRTADSINKLAEAMSKSAGDGKYKS